MIFDTILYQSPSRSGALKHIYGTDQTAQICRIAKPILRDAMLCDVPSLGFTIQIDVYETPDVLGKSRPVRAGG